MTEPGLFRCDELDLMQMHIQPPSFAAPDGAAAPTNLLRELDPAAFVHEPRPCSYDEFVAQTIKWALEVQQAGEDVEREAAAVYDALSTDVKGILQPVLTRVRTLMGSLDCTFAWPRWLAVDSALCGKILHGMLYGGIFVLLLAFFALLAVVVMYKVWRHFKDNRVVGLELERMEAKWGYLDGDRSSSDRGSQKSGGKAAVGDKAPPLAITDAPRV